MEQANLPDALPAAIVALAAKMVHHGVASAWPKGPRPVRRLVQSDDELVEEVGLLPDARPFRTCRRRLTLLLARALHSC